MGMGISNIDSSLFTMLLMMRPAGNHINYNNAHEMKRMHVICQQSACQSQLAMVSIKRLQFLASHNHHHLAHSPLSIDFCFFFANGRTIEFAGAALSLQLVMQRRFESSKIRMFCQVLKAFQPSNEPSR